MDQICSFFWFRDLDQPMFDLTSEPESAMIPDSVRRELDSKYDGWLETDLVRALESRAPFAFARVL